ncbi:MAG: hypothetical protein GKS04_03150 [Candidatus Mycalebacterium zealandia]|nr:MAG: hypothetical protein GKS04_03150 [Candidatus Mycalebacterium zealandia]
MFASRAQEVSSFDGGKFDGFYGGIDSAFVSNKAEGMLGPLTATVPVPSPAPPGTTVDVSQGPFPFGGTDNLAGGSLFAGYGITLNRVFAALEFSGSYGSYDDTKAFNSPNFTSDIDITQGFFGITTRVGFLLKENTMVYSNIGWGRSWVEATGTVKTISLPPNPSVPDEIAIAVLDRPVHTDVTFDGISFGAGFEYALGEIIGVEGIRARLSYTRIEQGKETFTYEATGLSSEQITAEFRGSPFPITIQDEQIPAQADASANVFSFGLLYSL